MAAELTLDVIIALANAVLGIGLIVLAALIASKYSKSLNRAVTFIVAANFFLALHEILEASIKVQLVPNSEVLLELIEMLTLLSLLLAAYYGLRMKLLELEQ